MDKNILTVNELSEVTGLTPRRIYQGIRAGVIPKLQFCPRGMYLIPYDEFQAAVRNLSRQNLQRGNDESNVVSFNGIRKVKE